MDLDSLAGDFQFGDGPAPVLALPMPGVDPPGPAPSPLPPRSRPPPREPPQLEGVPVGYLLDDGHVRRGAGIALILAASGMIAGGVAAGLPGAFAGLSLVGATRNALRAQSQWSSPIEEQRIEAGHAAVMSAIGFAVVGYLTYQAYKSHYGIQEIT